MTVIVDVIGRSKGRGFAGTVKRHHFSRGDVTHGSKNTREPGSIGHNEYPGRVMKGKPPDDFVFTTAARSTSSASLRWSGGRRPTQCYKRGRLPTRPTTFVPESGYNRCRGRRDTHTTGRHRGTAMGSGHHRPGRGCRRRTQTTLSDGIHWRD